MQLLLKFQAIVAEREGELTCLQSALSDSEINRQNLSQKLAKVKEEYTALDQKYLSVLAVNENLQSEASEFECVKKEVARMTHEALQWKNELASKNVELTKLKDSPQEMAKLKEENDTLRKENADLKGDLEAQKLQVKFCSYIVLMLNHYISGFLLCQKLLITFH